MKGVSCVDLLPVAQHVSNVPNVAQNLPVGARLQQFWKTWAALGASAKVIRILREGYMLPFLDRPYLTRSPIIVSGYVHPLRNSYLMEALHELMEKKAIDLVKNQSSLSFSTDCSWYPSPTTNSDGS